MLFNSCDSSHLYHGHETCKLRPFNSNSYSAQLRPLGSAPNAQQAFQVRGASNVNIYPAESYGLLQSQDGDRYFQNMLHDACNTDDFWRSHEHQQTTPEGYQVSPTYNAIPSHHHYPSLAISHLQWNRDVSGYQNSTGEMVDYLYSSNAYQTIQPSHSQHKPDIGEEMAIFSNRSSSGQGIVAMDNQAPSQLPLFNQRQQQTLSGRDGLKCNEANSFSFLKCSSSSLMQQHHILDNSVLTTSGSNHSLQTQIKVDSAFVPSLFRKTEERKLDKKNLGSSNEDVCMYSITSPSIDAHQRKSTKSTGRSLPYYSGLL